MSISFEEIGTHWEIEVEGLTSAEIGKLESQIRDLFSQFSSLYSRFSANSTISQIAKRSGRYRLDHAGDAFFPLYEKIYRLSGGRVTPLIGNVLEELGYDATYSFRAGSPQTPLALPDIVKWDSPYVTVTTPCVLDFGACGKGYAIDAIRKIILSYNSNTFIINGGGDLSIASKVPAKIGLEHPEDAHSVIGVAEIQDGNICASAGNRRKWRNYSHIMDPLTLTSADGVLATWVVSSTAIVADLLATALFFTKPDVLQSEFDFEYVIVYPDYTITKSDGFPGELFTA